MAFLNAFAAYNLRSKDPFSCRNQPVVPLDDIQITGEDVGSPHQIVCFDVRVLGFPTSPSKEANFCEVEVDHLRGYTESEQDIQRKKSGKGTQGWDTPYRS